MTDHRFADLKNMNAGKLAACLEIMDDFPHNGAGLAMLDEATRAFADQYPQVADASRAFGEARYRHKRSFDPATDGYSHEAWAAALQAAHHLADALRTLGEARIRRPG